MFILIIQIYFHYSFWNSLFRNLLRQIKPSRFFGYHTFCAIPSGTHFFPRNRFYPKTLLSDLSHYSSHMFITGCLSNYGDWSHIRQTRKGSVIAGSTSCFMTRIRIETGRIHTKEDMARDGKEGMQVVDRFGQMKTHQLCTVDRDARSQFS